MQGCRFEISWSVRYSRFSHRHLLRIRGCFVVRGGGAILAEQVPPPCSNGGCWFTTVGATARGGAGRLGCAGGSPSSVVDRIFAIRLSRLLRRFLARGDGCAGQARSRVITHELQRRDQRKILHAGRRHFRMNVRRGSRRLGAAMLVYDLNTGKPRVVTATRGACVPTFEDARRSTPIA